MKKSIAAIERVKVQQHIRKEHGKIVPVKQYFAERDVKADMEDLISKLHKIKEIDTYPNNEIISAYKTGFNTIHDDMWTRDEYNLSNVYDYAIEDFPGLIDGDKAKSILTDKEFVKKTSARVDDIEKFFNDTLKIKTQRLTPFTFTFDHGITGSQYSIDMVDIKKHLSDFYSPFEIDYEEPHKGHVQYDIENIINDQMSKKNPNWNKVANYEIPTYLTEYLVPMFFAKGDENKKFTTTPENYVASDTIKSQMEKYDDKGINYYTEDPEVARKELRQLLTAAEKEKGIRQTKLNKNLKSMKPTEIMPILEWVRRTDTFPDFLLKSDFIKNAQNFGKRLVDDAKINGVGLKSKMFVTKNPLELITMAPMGNFESCQSIYNEWGRPSIGNLNTNILTAIFGDVNNDFILMTAKETKNGHEKTARASINYNENVDKLVSYEGFRIFSSSRRDADTMSKQLEKIDKHTEGPLNVIRKSEIDIRIKNGESKWQNQYIDVDEDEVRFQSNHYDKIETALNKLENKRHDTHDTDEIADIVKEINTMRGEMEEIRNNANSWADDIEGSKSYSSEAIVDPIFELIDEGHSILYNSPLAEAINNMANKILDLNDTIDILLDQCTTLGRERY